MDWFVTGLGVALVLAALRDIFHTIWHPVGGGGFSRWMMRSIWRLSHRFTRRGQATALAGPLAMVAVVCMWTSSVIAGWTLIYWPHLPHDFAFAPGLDPHRSMGLLDALYLSLVTVATLGFGDIVPEAGWLRVAAPVQALIGFALLTATVSWVLQIYPTLMRRRRLAIKLDALRRSDAAGVLARSDGAFGTVLLNDLADDLMEARVDFVQYGESYYFHDGEERSSLATSIGYAVDLAGTAQRSPREDVRLAATVLEHALDDLAAVLDVRFLHVGGDTARIFDAYAADHDRSVVSR
jgi:hypothetical protein